MFQFLESICIQNSRFQLIELHQERLNSTFKKYYPDCKPHSLKQSLQNVITSHFLKEKKYKLRFLYDAHEFEITTAEYQPKNVASAKCVKGEAVRYDFKTIDRSPLDQLYQRRSGMDDIIILDPEGYVTDSYYANLAFFDGENWYTPDTFLLNGVKRQYLLANGKLIEKRIHHREIADYQKLSLINAMLDLNEVSFRTYNVRY